MAQHFQSARTRPWKVVATEATEAASRLCLNPRQESSEATPANKMASISDLLHAIKTDPEVKQLLASALANDKPYALNLNSNCASELLPGEYYPDYESLPLFNTVFSDMYLRPSSRLLQRRQCE